MRVRSLLAAFGAATLLVGLTAAPAVAGTGSSMACSDGVGYREVPILTSPVTVAVELADPPGGDYQTVRICYSTTSPGTPAVISSGAITLRIATGTGTAHPGASVAIACVPDYVTGVGLSCGFVNSAHVAPGDVGVTQQPTVCLVTLGSACAVFVPSIRINPNEDPNRALLWIQVLSIPIGFDAQCLPVSGLCP